MAVIAKRNVTQLGPEVGHKPTTGELISGMRDGEPVIGLTVLDDQGEGYLIFESETVTYLADHNMRFATPLSGELVIEPADETSVHPLPKAKNPDQSGLLVNTGTEDVVIRLMIHDGGHKFQASYNLATGEVWAGKRLGLSSGFRVLLHRSGDDEAREITRII